MLSEAKHLKTEILRPFGPQNDKPKVSGPLGYPVLGHIPQFLSDKLGFLMKCAQGYGDVVKLKIGEPTYLILHPEDIKHVLEVHSQNYERGPRITSRSGKRLYGEGLFTAEDAPGLPGVSGAVPARGDRPRRAGGRAKRGPLTAAAPDHRKLKELLLPLFSPQAMGGFAEIITETTGQMLGRWHDGQELDISREMTRLIFRINGKILFGLDFENDAMELAEAIRVRRDYIQYTFDSLFPFPEAIPNAINRKFQEAMKIFDHTIFQLIRKRRFSESAPLKDMFSMLARRRNNHAEMSDQQIRDECLMLSSAGYETTAEALSWTWFLLAQHPEEEAKLTKELENALQGRPPRTEDLPKLTYLEMILSESMRLYPPTWLFVRVTKTEDQLPTGVKIPQGAKLYLSPYVNHRNPAYFPNPEEFDPERFRPVFRQDRPKYAYFPFGGGARSCIGQNLATMTGMLVIALVGQKFRLALAPGQTVVPDPKVTLRPKNGIRVRLIKR